MKAINNRCRTITALALCMMLIIGIMPLNVSARSASRYKVLVDVSSETDRDTSSKTIDVSAGDKVTVAVSVEGGHFVAADITLKYDTSAFRLTQKIPSGWYTDDYAGMDKDGEKATGVLRFLKVKSDNGEWANGTVLGTFEFEALKTKTSKNNVEFSVNSRDAYIVKDWADGTSSDGAEPIKTSHLKNAAVNLYVAGNSTDTNANGSTDTNANGSSTNTDANSSSADTNTDGSVDGADNSDSSVTQPDNAQDSTEIVSDSRVEKDTSILIIAIGVIIALGAAAIIFLLIRRRRSD